MVGMEKTILELQTQISQQLKSLSETASLDAQVLLANLLNQPRSWILAHPEHKVGDEKYHEIGQALDRLINGEPLPYVIGHWEFYGLDFILTPDVLIPRPETELLVERAIDWLQHHPERPHVVDVGTGSGCIGISIASHVSDSRVLLTDVSAEALKVARLNAIKHRLQNSVEICRSSLLTRLPEPGAFDLICANLPYIPTPELETLKVYKKEPRLALDGGQDGLKHITRLIKQAKTRLAPGGMMLLEIEPSESNALRELITKNLPYSRMQILQDLSGIERCVQIEKPDLIYHLCLRKQWEHSMNEGQYEADSLVLEGFIHCSQRDQIIPVANRYYKGTLDMVVLAIDPQTLVSEIRWEAVRDEKYPHVYGPVNREAVLSVHDILPDQDGIFRSFSGK